MTIRIYATDSGILVTDARGKLLDPHSREPTEEGIYEARDRKIVASERVFAAGDSVNIYHASDVWHHQRELEKPDPGAAYEHVGQYPFPVTIKSTRTFSEEDFDRFVKHVASARAAYDSQRQLIDATYQQHLARLNAQRDEALARLREPTLEALLIDSSPAEV